MFGVRAHGMICAGVNAGDMLVLLSAQEGSSNSSKLFNPRAIKTFTPLTGSI